jgi:hypothetical protein
VVHQEWMDGLSFRSRTNLHRLGATASEEVTAAYRNAARRIKRYCGMGSSLVEPASGFGMNSIAAFSVSNHCLP